MKYLSVCRGIEAATVAWHPLGWEPAAFAEIEKFPSAVLAHHYPRVTNHGDFTTIKGDEYGAVDVLVGGTPCQDFSVAGLRAGMDGARGQLTVEFAHVAGRLRPRWLVWENVPGVLSIDGGRAFGTFLGLLGQLGYGFAYRVLDAQHFGVPQRRRRVFVVGYLGDWRRAAAVLFERHSLSGHPAPRREAGQSAPTIPSRSTGGGGLGTDFDCDGELISAAVTSKWAKGCGGPAGDECQNLMAHSLRADGFDASEDGTGREDCVSSDVHFGALGSSSPHAQAVAFNLRGRQGGAMPEAGDLASIRAASGGSSRSYVAAVSANQRGEVREREVHGSLNGSKSGKQFDGIRTASAVRRITPRECERLQGFPDDYTLVTYRGKPAADGPRYKALGNSMAVPVMRWIGERI